MYITGGCENPACSASGPCSAAGYLVGNLQQGQCDLFTGCENDNKAQRELDMGVEAAAFPGQNDNLRAAAGPRVSAVLLTLTSGGFAGHQVGD